MSGMRMVATDLDGTIVRADGTVSERTVAALQACQDAGVLVVYVTGRPVRWMADVVAQTGHRGIALCGNGAVVYDLGAERVLTSRPMTADAVLLAAQRLTEALPDAAFAVETLSGFRREPGYQDRWDDVRDPDVAALEQLVREDPMLLKL
jgi:HAD superfamily hydrolase (TIGR01484 family)